MQRSKKFTTTQKDQGSYILPVHMKILCNARTAILIIIGCLVLTTCVSASGELAGYIGDTIIIQGYLFGSPTVDLFLTGSNLPVNGVALNDITARADEGHFTEVSVDSNDHWEYSWGTNAIGGRLDAGIYTAWVVDRPNDRSLLAKADYSTITIRLGTPVIMVNSSVIPGALILNTSPDGASVLIDDVYRGSTPLIIEKIEPGTYSVTFSRIGYTKLSTPVQVASGKTTEVSGALIPFTGSVDITTSPSGARILLDTVYLGTTLVRLSNITVGNRTLTIVKEGYVNAEQMVTVFEGRTTNLSLTHTHTHTHTYPHFGTSCGYVTSGRTCPGNPDCGFYHDSPGYQAFEHIIVNGAKLPASHGNKGKKPTTMGIAGCFIWMN